MTHPLFTKHEATLNQALAAIATRGYWSPFPEMPSPKVYGETASSDGEAAFKAHLNRTFDLDSRQPARRLAMSVPPLGSRSEFAIRKRTSTHCWLHPGRLKVSGARPAPTRGRA